MNPRLRGNNGDPGVPARGFEAPGIECLDGVEARACTRVGAEAS